LSSRCHHLLKPRHEGVALWQKRNGEIVIRIDRKVFGGFIALAVAILLAMVPPPTARAFQPASDASLNYIPRMVMRSGEASAGALNDGLIARTAAAFFVSSSDDVALFVPVRFESRRYDNSAAHALRTEQSTAELERLGGIVWTGGLIETGLNAVPIQ
jgi:hypothetical protein